ncbi:MAG: heat-inducible transcription repressor HrcA [Gammaproteobacteria bacterium]|jgi:heat-inducible transcriptional repressor|nr:heat-inducible transcription repressor HrcA [Gammaproteobacteria bacterium]
MRKQAEDSLDERAQRVFKLLVEQYIAEGTPVPSRTLAAAPGVEVSPATVRNILADLESQGLVRSPHTSAGKIPTNRGLRFFVDSLLSVQPLDEAQVMRLRGEIDPDLSPTELVQSASKALSHLTHMTCLITLPRRDQAALRHVEFLPLSGNRVLVILVLGDREVQNRVIHTERSYTEPELNQAANFINREFGGRSLLEVRDALLESMQADKDRMDGLMQTALDVASRAFEDSAEPPGSELVVAGETNLLDFGDIEQVRKLFDAFSRKSGILHLLDRCLDSHGIQLFIGEESGYRLLDDWSLVTASYEVQGRLAGVLGVVGPTRMAYQEVIPVVDLTAQVLSAAMRRA